MTGNLSGKKKTESRGEDDSRSLRVADRRVPSAVTHRVAFSSLLSSKCLSVGFVLVDFPVSLAVAGGKAEGICVVRQRRALHEIAS